MSLAQDPFVRYTDNLVSCLQWLFSVQNHDGSWGSRPEDRIRWTSNAVYALSKLGFESGRVKTYGHAIDWLKAVPKTWPEWYLRIPALSAAGLSDWLDKNGDYQAAAELLRRDSIGSLAVKVAFATELLSVGVPVPNLEHIRTSILATRVNEDGDLVSFASSTNDTTLYANFLRSVGNPDDDKTIDECIRWVKIRAVAKAGGASLCWEESYGKTAYVAVNLIQSSSDGRALEPLILKALNYFEPGQDGAIPPDSVPAHESRDSIYTTILFIRAFATFLAQASRYCEGAFVALITKMPPTQTRASPLLRRVFSIAVATCVCIDVALVVYFVAGRDFLMSVLASIVAAMIAIVFQIFWTRRDSFGNLGKE